MNEQLANLICAAAEYDRGDARRIQHFIKVHDFALTIALLEHLDSRTSFTLEAAAILHDIGIHEAERKYGDGNGHYQEIEGPAAAMAIMKQVGGFTPDTMERVCWLIAHHHHCDNISAIDHQILVEADFLVNSMEEGLAATAIESFSKRVFKTSAGLRLLEAQFPARHAEEP